MFSNVSDLNLLCLVNYLKANLDFGLWFGVELGLGILFVNAKIVAGFCLKVHALTVTTIMAVTRPA